MKGKIGIICLLLISLYCLSAVCAADLNQTADDIKTNDDVVLVDDDVKMSEEKCIPADAEDDDNQITDGSVVLEENDTVTPEDNGFKKPKRVDLPICNLTPSLPRIPHIPVNLTQVSGVNAMHLNHADNSTGPSPIESIPATHKLNPVIRMLIDPIFQKETIIMILWDLKWKMECQN